MLFIDYNMVNSNSSNIDDSKLCSHSEQRITVLSSLARIIANTHLRRTAVNTSRSIETTLPNNQGNSTDKTGNGDVAQL